MSGCQGSCYDNLGLEKIFGVRLNVYYAGIIEAAMKRQELLETSYSELQQVNGELFKSCDFCRILLYVT